MYCDFIIGLSNVLASNRRQAIVYTNCDQLQRCMYAALEVDKLFEWF